MGFENHNVHRRAFIYDEKGFFVRSELIPIPPPIAWNIAVNGLWTTVEPVPLKFNEIKAGKKLRYTGSNHHGHWTVV